MFGSGEQQPLSAQPFTPYDASAATTHVVADDPFLTHKQQAERAAKPSAPPAPVAQRTESGGQRDLHADPFMAHKNTPPSNMTVGVDDPFLTHMSPAERAQKSDNSAPRVPPRLSNQAKIEDLATNPFLKHDKGPDTERFKAPMRLTDFHVPSFFDIFGAGDPTREPWVGFCYALVPFAFYVYIVLLQLVVQHYSWNLTWIFTMMAIISCVGMSLSGVRRRGSVNYIVLGLLCFVGVCLGCLTGSDTYHHHARPVWWLHTGVDYAQKSADTPASSVIDAAKIDFHIGDKLVDGTAVDSTRSAGYKNGVTFCVAPVLNQNLTLYDTFRVEFWAVGIDCCSSYGGFTCDKSRSASSTAVVMLDRGFPCPGCHSDSFSRAVEKASAQWNLVSSDDALYLRMVSDATEFTDNLVLHLCLAVFGYAFVVLLLFAAMSFPMYYYGLFRPAPEKERNARPSTVRS